MAGAAPNGTMSVTNLIANLKGQFDNTDTASTQKQASANSNDNGVISIEQRRREAEEALRAVSSTAQNTTSKEAQVNDALASAPDAVPVPGDGIQALREKAAQLEQATALADIKSGQLIGHAALATFVSGAAKLAQYAPQAQGAQQAQSPSLETLVKQAAALGHAHASARVAPQQTGVNVTQDQLVEGIKTAAHNAQNHAQQLALRGIVSAAGEDAVKVAQHFNMVDESMDKLAHACVAVYQQGFQHVDALLSASNAQSQQ